MWFWKKSSVRGYLWESELHFPASPRPEVGAVVRLPDRGPPWLVVNHDPEGVITSGAGRLWLVEVVDAVTPAEQKARNSKLRPDVRYSRAVAVKVIEALPLASLYGRHGERIASILSVASTLTKEDADALALARHTKAASAQLEAWRAWLKREGLPSFPDANYDGTLAAGQGGAESPIGRGFMAIHAALTGRAIEFDGDAALQDDPDDPDDGAFLVAPWSGAGAALCDAAFAFGAPELLSTSDHDTLAHSWRRVFGRDP
ncbi:MAG TPA: hypothetical protein PLS69_12195 [Terricaulis sp.]|nr:hypothetical protein [Terricaulis sp.]